MGLKEYPEGSQFTGVVGRTVGDSEPAWPQPLRAKGGAPNVLYIVLDDVGFAQLGCYGSDIETPNIDHLAANGLRFTNWHTTALCSPTRSCLLTGRNHHSNGMACITEGATGFPGYNGQIPKENGFLSEVLLRNGYSTFAIGKWHLTPSEETNMASRKDRWPLGRGFERYYGFLGGETDQWDPDLVHDNHFIEPPARTPYYHLSEDLTDKAVEFIQDLKAVAPDKPFFMYLAYGACHAPHHVPREWADRYKGRFDKGWDQWREDTLHRQKQLGVVPENTKLPPREEEVQAWDELAEDERKLYARMMEVFAGFLSHTDHQIGRLLKFLEKIGQLENTLILVVSDNGASAEGGKSGSVNENLFFNMVPDSLQDNLRMMDELGGPHTYNHYPMGWTSAGNTPYRRWKRETYNGGISDPMVVHWPQGIQSKGKIRDQYCHAVDIVPTVLELLGIESPRHIAGVAQRPIEGTSFAYALDDGQAKTRKPVQYYEMLGQRALWHDGWKATCYHELNEPVTEQTLSNAPWELYRVDPGGPEPADRAETRNLAEKYPEKLKELVQRWWVEAGKHQVLPLDGRGQQRLAEPKPQLVPDRTRYVYWPFGNPVPESVAASVKNRSHTLTAEVEIPDSGAEGVLLAHGGRFGGYTFFLKDQRLHYVHNFVGKERYRISSQEKVPAGRCTLRFEFVKTGDHQGQGTLLINGKKVGEGRIPHTTPIAYALSGEGLCCGWDSGLPVCEDYRSPFRFTAPLHQVVVEVEGERIRDHEKETGIALATQ